MTRAQMATKVREAQRLIEKANSEIGDVWEEVPATDPLDDNLGRVSMQLSECLTMLGVVAGQIAERK